MPKTSLKQSVSKTGSLGVEFRALQHANLSFHNGLSKMGVEEPILETPSPRWVMVSAGVFSAFWYVLVFSGGFWWIVLLGSGVFCWILVGSGALW